MMSLVTSGEKIPKTELEGQLILMQVKEQEEQEAQGTLRLA